ncbi:MAG: transposase [Anaerovibrio lipolyticus]|nr:transposase [Anaerovibrio lipolyticus]
MISWPRTQHWQKSSMLWTRILQRRTGLLQMIERWFRSLKTEQIYPNEYDSPRELRKLVNDYVDTYNSLRPHEALDYKVPDEVFYGCFAA